MHRPIALFVLAALLAVAPAVPARAAGPVSFLNRIARSLGLGWSDGYHAGPGPGVWVEPGWEGQGGESYRYYEAVPPGPENVPLPASSRRQPVPAR